MIKFLKNYMTTQKMVYNILKILVFLFFAQDLYAKDRVTVAVASNFLMPIKQLSPLFETANDVNVRLVSGSTAKLYAQIQQGAPYDVFLSADQKTVQKLVDAGSVKPSEMFLYARGQIALWAVGRSNAEQLLKENKFEKLVIANPSLAPYGLAAREVLEALGLTKTYSGKIIYAENVAQAYQFTYHQNVDAGFVAFSQLKAKNIQSDYWLVPGNLYQPVEQYGAVLRHSQNHQLAEKFKTFMLSKKIQHKIVNDFGYGQN